MERVFCRDLGPTWARVRVRGEQEGGKLQNTTVIMMAGEENEVEGDR